MNKKLCKLFATAFLQVLFVAGNTYFIANLHWIGLGICSFAISYLWATNVKKMAMHNDLQRIVYALGAASGAIAGTYIATMIN